MRLSPKDTQVAEYVWRHPESADSQGNVYMMMTAVTATAISRNTQMESEIHTGHLIYTFPQLFQEDGSITVLSRGQKWLLEAQQTTDDNTRLCTALQRTMPRGRGLSIDGRASQGHVCCMRWPLWFCCSFFC